MNFGAGQIQQWTRNISGTDWEMRGGSSVKPCGDSSQVTVSCNIDASYREAFVGVVFRAAQEDAPTATPSITPTPTPTEPPEQGWAYANYTYGSSRPHAVTGVEHGAVTDTFGYPTKNVRGERRRYRGHDRALRGRYELDTDLQRGRTPLTDQRRLGHLDLHLPH